MRYFFLILFSISIAAKGQDQIIKEVFKLSGHTGGIASLAFSPDGRYLVSGSQDESLKIWDLSTKKEIETIHKFGSTHTSLAFSPQNGFLAVGFYEILRIYKPQSWKKVTQKTLFPAFVESIAISPDGKQLIASSWKDKSLLTMDFPALSNIKELKENNWTDAISFSKDGQLFVTGSHANSIKIWEAASGSLINQFQNHKDWIYGCSFFDKNSKIVSAGLDSQIVISDSKTGKILDSKKGHEAGISYGLVLADEKSLVTASLDKTLKIWQLQPFELLTTFSGSKEKLITLATSVDGTWIATGGSDTIVYLIRLK